MRRGPGSGIGASSILVITVSLCLTVFGLLALTSVRGDMALSTATSESTTAYYEADRAAQLAIAEIDAVLAEVGDDRDAAASSLAATLPEAELSDQRLSFAVDIDQRRELRVELRLWPDSGSRYSITRYSIAIKGDSHAYA